MLLKAFACHARYGGGRSIDFQTADVAALTFHATEWFNARVADLSGRAIDAAPQFAIQNHSAADASAECQTHNRAVPAPRALPHLTERCCISIVLDQDRTLKI